MSSQDCAPENLARFPIVGIGASAGGLEAFTQLLHHLPGDTGMAFVLVQHLDPTRKSLLSEILARVTPMPVIEGQNGCVVEANHIYVMPSDSVMMIEQGTLQLTPREPVRTTNKTVDAFLCSLAAEQGDQAIGVILSGADTDGTCGLEAIKAAGGITFAQSEASAQVDRMPHTAIATGQVDFILPPAEIAEKLAEISRHPYTRLPAVTETSEPLSDRKDDLTRIFNLLHTATRVDFTHYKRTTIRRRILRRMALQRLERLEDYVDYLNQHPAEVQALSEEILIHVTSFFRDAAAFEALQQQVFPAILRDRSAKSPIRVWVAGCSTGEEAYSIAICLLEFFADQPDQPPMQIFATDASAAMIEQARTGYYPPHRLTEVSASRLQQFFVPVGEGYQVKKTVRELCVFAQQNLIADPPFSRLDLISCRNVLIYFGAVLQKKVLRIFHYGLKPASFLLLGTSETIGEDSDLFALVNQKQKIYAKQAAVQRLDFEAMTNYDPIEPAPLAGQPNPSTELELYWAADQLVLNHYAPVGVLINAQLEIVQFRGQTGAYLDPTPGRASLNLLALVREGLRLELRTAIHQAKQNKQPIRTPGIPFQSGDRSSSVHLHVIPLLSNTLNEDHLLVLFEEEPAASETEPTVAQPASGRKKSNRAQQTIQQLQQELETTKLHLQTIINEQQATNQDLRAANEEILSSNEELQSINEELQTAKEEIQATNEELSSINDELHCRNTEATQISNDLQNLLSSTNIPILMLEGDLKIRRFTPVAANLFNLIPTDMGRPLSDIKHNLNITDLEQQILDVINTLTVYSQEVQDQSGLWYDLRIRPYRTIDNRIDGAVIVLVEIDALKRSIRALQEARDYAEAIVQTVRQPLVVLDSDLQVVTANPQFYDTFQVRPTETEQASIFNLGNGQWNIPALRSLLEDTLSDNTQIQDFVIEHDFEQIGQKTMALNVRQMPMLEGRQFILLAIEDVTEL